MYYHDNNHQYSLEDFDQPVGLKLDPDDYWIKKADMIPWEKLESKYAALFPSNTGMPAKPFRMALGSLLIQMETGYSDAVLVRNIKENPYLQKFIGLPGYQMEAPFATSLLVEFRKRLDEDKLIEINEMIIEYNQAKEDSSSGSDSSEESAQGAGDDSGETSEESAQSTGSDSGKTSEESAQNAGTLRNCNKITQTSHMKCGKIP